MVELIMVAFICLTCHVDASMTETQVRHTQRWVEVSWIMCPGEFPLHTCESVL